MQPSMKAIAVVAALIAGFGPPGVASASAGAPPAAPAERAPQKDNGIDSVLQPVARFGNDFKLVGIGVSHDGRIFASAPASAHDRGTASLVEVDPQTGRKMPYPNAAWNHYRARADGAHQWISVQALWVDRAQHLWVLDKSLPGAPGDQPAKLVEFDLSTDRPIHSYTFTQTLEPKDSLNDVRVDLKHGDAYLSNAKNGGGIVVLNLKTGASRMVLRGDRSSVADPGQHLMFGKKVARAKNGKPLELDTDGIALSPDRRWVYYRPLSDRHYWRVPTAALIDPSLSATQRAARVQYLGDHVLSGGLAMSNAGVLYAGDLEHHGVVALTPDGAGASGHRSGIAGSRATVPMQSQWVVHDRSQLAWADGFAIADGYLYISDSHLNETSFANGYPRAGRFTIFRVPLVHGTGGAPDPE